MDEGFCRGSELILARYRFPPFSLISFSSFFSLVAFMLPYLSLYDCCFFIADNSLLRLEELYLLNLGSLEEKLVTLNLSAFCS